VGMSSNIHFSEIKKHIMGHINSARVSIKLAVSWLTDKEIFALLLGKLSSGVGVSLVTRNDYLNNNPEALRWNDFIKAGGKLCFSRNGEQLHYKFILTDDKAVLCTSYNLTCFANGNNRENVMIFDEPVIVAPFVSEFEYLVSTLAKESNVKRIQLGDVAEEMHGFYKVTLENDKVKQDA
jgi:phosphatidylserine/phosphatidylglycerophosphate/cardiolipin synthase-like enzyme